MNFQALIKYLIFLVCLSVFLSPSPVFAGSSFLYTAGGQRIAKLSGEGDHTYYLPGVEVTVKPDGSLSSRKYYTFNGALVGIRDKSGISYTHSDQLGSAALTTDANGSLVGSAAYFPYGTTRGLSGTMAGERKYTGQVSDEDMTGLYYYNARYYSPTLGRFTQADTASSGQNRYTYVGNDPINFSDPSGHIKNNEGEGSDTSYVPPSENLFRTYMPFFQPNQTDSTEVPYINHPLYFNSSFVGDTYEDISDRLPWFFTIPPLNFSASVVTEFYVYKQGDSTVGLGIVSSNYRYQEEYLEYRDRIFADIDFNAGTELEFLKSFALSVDSNTVYDYESISARSQGLVSEREAYLIPRITSEYGGVCRHFAAISNLLLGDLGIESEIVAANIFYDSEARGHAFLRVYIDTIPYIVDPTLGEAMSQSEYSLKYGVTNYYPLGSYVTSACPSGACHYNP